MGFIASPRQMRAIRTRKRIVPRRKALTKFVRGRKFYWSRKYRRWLPSKF